MIPIPTLTQLYTDILADLETQLGVNISLFGKVFLRALAMVQAGKLKLFYLSVAFLQKNIWPDTADPESKGGTLERFGRVKLNRNPFPAQAGQYTATITGTIGSSIPASSTFKSNDTSTNPGKLFVLDNAFTSTANPDTITIRALETGIDSKLSPGDQLTATAPIIGISSIITIATEAIPPLAAETTDDYRRKTVDAFRLEAQGGASGDYRLWSYDAQGVKQVYPYAKSNATGEVNVYVEATAADSTDGQGTPSAQLLLDVEAVVETDPDTTKPANERPRRPIQVIVHFLPVTVRQVEINISLFTGLTAAIQAEILAALTAEIDKVRPFIAGCDVLEEKNDILDTNKIISVILNTRPGSSFGPITLKVSGTTFNTFTFQNGDIPHLLNVTYI